jgi:hypothetical protein
MRIFQSYFDDTSKQYLDPSAEPVDVSFNLNHPLYEYNILRTLLDGKIMDPGTGPVGLISWKFETKTLVSVGEFSGFCDKAFAAGADVAFINPMVAAEALYKNVWEQGEHIGHAGMLGILSALFSEQQIDRLELMPKSIFALCNYFVGNITFWSEYRAFCDDVLRRIEALKETNPTVFNRIYDSANYRRNEAADFRPFILERLFSTFLLLSRDIKRANFEYSSDVYERKFGKNNGKYLYLLSGLKNNGIYSGNGELLKKWHETRLQVLNAPAGIWAKDDPQPGEAARNQSAEAANMMTVTLTDIEPDLSQKLTRRELDAVLDTTGKLAYQLCMLPALMGRALFLPQLDALMEDAAKAFVPAAMHPAAGPIVVHVATEVYETGGHTRVLEDIARALPEYRHVLILTDIMENYRAGRLVLGFLKGRFDTIKLEVIFLQETTLAQKALELAAHIARLAPQAVALLGHHFDTIANAGVSGHSAPRVLYIHHCDFSPALGATRGDYIHVDVTPSCHAMCKTVRASPSVFLGLSVEDRGVVEFSARKSLVGVTCGGPHKYAGRNEFSYAELLAALFANGIENIIHIGAMSPEQMNQIQKEIDALGQDAGRVIFQGNTPSLTDSLQEIMPGFFLCSFPTGGGKAMLEAMSVGLPLLIPRPGSTAPLIGADIAHGVGLTIKTLQDVPGIVRRLRTEEQGLGRRHREIFEQYYSMPVFRKKLLGLIREGEGSS